MIEEKKFDVSLWKMRLQKQNEKAEVDRKQILAYTIDFLNSAKEMLPVDSIYIFGSILRENMFDENSDIDIAIKGLRKNERFFKLWTSLDQIPNRDVDVLDLDECSFAELVYKYGLKIK